MLWQPNSVGDWPDPPNRFFLLQGAISIHAVAGTITSGTGFGA